MHEAAGEIEAQMPQGHAGHVRPGEDILILRVSVDQWSEDRIGVHGQVSPYSVLSDSVLAE